VFQGTTDSAVFEDFIEQLLHHCRPYPEPNSVIVMDNASFHRTERIEQICAEADVKLSYLPPYSPDLNPTEEFFAELKAFIKSNGMSMRTTRVKISRCSWNDALVWREAKSRAQEAILGMLGGVLMR
jgi:transposase